MNVGFTRGMRLVMKVHSHLLVGLTSLFLMNLLACESNAPIILTVGPETASHYFPVRGN